MAPAFTDTVDVLEPDLKKIDSYNFRILFDSCSLRLPCTLVEPMAIRILEFQRFEAQGNTRV